MGPPPAPLSAGSSLAGNPMPSLGPTPNPLSLHTPPQQLGIDMANGSAQATVPSGGARPIGLGTIAPRMPSAGGGSPMRANLSY